jgi:Flp pilus assembly protein TadG
MVLVLLAMSVFLMAAMGLAIDGSHLYAQRQLAQAAADAGAQAGIMSIFNGTNTSGAHQFADVSGTVYSCASGDARTPCYYAQTLNGFNVAGSDTLTYTPNPAGVSVPNLSSDPINLLQVSVTRNVPATLMKLLGWSTIPVTASATAAIVTVESPVPIIVTHPTLAGSFSISGTGSTPKITICGGPHRSIQVNSSASSINANGNPVVDLSHAGPTVGACNGAGGEFANFGTPSAAGFVSSTPFVLLPGASSYVHASPIQDPLLGVTPPTAPANAHAPVPLADGAYGCPSPSVKACTLYFPGSYTTTTTPSTIDIQNSTAVFAPGIYYMNGATVDFRTHANGYMQMATGLTDNSTTSSVTLTAGTLNSGGVTSCCGTNQGWDGTVANGGMLVYMTGPSSSGGDTTGQIIVGANGSVSLIGSASCPTATCAASPVTGYDNILFFVDRNAAAQSHTLDGGGGLILIGTIYAPETVATMTAHPTQYQTLNLQGNAGSSTNITGEIIASALSLGGTPGIVMTLSGLPLPTRQVALVQ